MIGVRPAGDASALEGAGALSSHATSSRSAAPLIVAAARRARPNDPTFPLVCLALASGEGGLTLPAPQGDGGTSYGPFQMHRGGALPAGKGDAWANSPEGIQYAVNQIDQATRGLSGPAAVSAGVTRWERPAQPAPEINRDLAWYRQAQAQGGPPGLVPPGNFPNPGGALGTGSGTIQPGHYTPGLFDCSGSDSYFFGLISTPSTGAIGCYLLGALKLVGMAVLGGGLALAGFYLVLPRSKGNAIVRLLPVGGTSSSGSRRQDDAGAASPASSPPPDEHREAIKGEQVKQARARTRQHRARARELEHRARQAKQHTGTSYSLSPAAEASLRRASSAPRRGRPDRMAG